MTRLPLAAVYVAALLALAGTLRRSRRSQADGSDGTLEECLRADLAQCQHALHSVIVAWDDEHDVLTEERRRADDMAEWIRARHEGIPLPLALHDAARSARARQR